MTHETFRSNAMHHMHVAIVATSLGLSIDELIDDLFNNEFDDFAIYNIDDFNRAIDYMYEHFVN